MRKHVYPLTGRQVQPNGIDLTVEKITGQTGTPVFRQRDEMLVNKNTGPYDVHVGTFSEHPPGYITGLPEPGWKLSPGNYIVHWAETVSVPAGAVGLIIPRSSLLRSGNALIGALWDRGYRGRGSSLLLLNDTIMLEKGARLAQLIFLPAETDSESYDGRYQDEE